MLSDKELMGIALVGVLLIAVIFIRRALKSRKQYIAANGKPGKGNSCAVVTTTTLYRMMFICPSRIRSKDRKQANIRGEYHEKIAEIVQCAGQENITISGYLDNILRDHFETYRDDIARLCEDYRKGSGDAKG